MGKANRTRPVKTPPGSPANPPLKKQKGQTNPVMPLLPPQQTDKNSTFAGKNNELLTLLAAPKGSLSTLPILPDPITHGALSKKQKGQTNPVMPLLSLQQTDKNSTFAGKNNEMNLLAAPKESLSAPTTSPDPITQGALSQALDRMGITGIKKSAGGVQQLGKSKDAQQQPKQQQQQQQEAGIPADTVAENKSPDSDTEDDDPMEEYPSSDSDATPPSHNVTNVYVPTPAKVHQLRYDVKLNLQPSSKPVEALREAITMFWSQIRLSDKDVIIYPYIRQIWILRIWAR
jgi:hypothetical protein